MFRVEEIRYLRLLVQKKLNTTTDGERIFEVTGNEYEIQEITKISKGNTLIEEVTSNHADEYPQDGNEGEYWYVYIDSIIQ